MINSFAPRAFYARLSVGTCQSAAGRVSGATLALFNAEARRTAKGAKRQSFPCFFAAFAPFAPWRLRRERAARPARAAWPIVIAAFVLAFASLRVQAVVFTVILVGFWAAFALYPLPAPGFDYTTVGVPADWPHLYSGFLAHFNKNSNLAWGFDVWFLNLFPRERPFLFNRGGWSTLSCVPTLATMILGLWCGEWLKTPRTNIDKLKGLVVAGVLCIKFL